MKTTHAKKWLTLSIIEIILYFLFFFNTVIWLSKKTVA